MSKSRHGRSSFVFDEKRGLDAWMLDGAEILMVQRFVLQTRSVQRCPLFCTRRAVDGPRSCHLAVPWPCIVLAKTNGGAATISASFIKIWNLRVDPNKAHRTASHDVYGQMQAQRHAFLIREKENKQAASRPRRLSTSISSERRRTECRGRDAAGPSDGRSCCGYPFDPF